jgi:hypothetical protein
MMIQGTRLCGSINHDCAYRACGAWWVTSLTFYAWCDIIEDRNLKSLVGRENDLCCGSWCQKTTDEKLTHQSKQQEKRGRYN